MAASVNPGAPQRHALCQRCGSESTSKADTIFGHAIPETLNNKSQTQQPKKSRQRNQGAHRLWQVRRRIPMEVEVCLMGRADTEDSKINSIYCDSITLDRCKSNLSRLRIHYETRNVFDAIKLARQNAQHGLLASPLLANIWGLNVLKHHMEDELRSEVICLLVVKTARV
ncbi:MAG: prephenate dehydratase domain-containing protein [Limisphaerales bacterium]